MGLDSFGDFDAGRALDSNCPFNARTLSFATFTLDGYFYKTS